MTDKISETPSQSIGKTEQATQTDAKGRLITVKRMNALGYYNLAKAMGESASNPTTMEMATIVAAVIKIDATPIAFPSSERDVQFLIQQLDFEGITAAGLAMAKLRVSDALEIETAKN